MLIEPAFLVEARSSVPTAGGPYRLEGYGPGGELRFGFDFTPQPVEFGGAALPLQRPVRPGPGRTAGAGWSCRGRRASSCWARRVRARWRSSSTGTSGQVRAILRDWDSAMALSSGDTEIMVSDGLPWGAR